ncbi:MAG TPA: DsbA family protein [Jatrophihabitans sp.]|nr:DsbA family protein [Jatrophihabitans sp.]
MSLIVYADFACPDCYLAARRADVLAAAGVEVDWRAVEHRRAVPVAGLPLSDSEQQELVSRLAGLDTLLLPGESLPHRLPTIRPRTEAAIAAYAAVSATPVGAEVRRLLFELYWRFGADIGSPSVLRGPLTGPVLRSGASAEPLRQSGYAVSFDRGPLTTEAFRRIRDWRREWADLGSPLSPVVLADGATLAGTDALRRLGKEIAYAGAPVDAALAEPRRYPPIDDRPPASWVSWVGGRWRNAYRPAAAG